MAELTPSSTKEHMPCAASPRTTWTSSAANVSYASVDLSMLYRLSEPLPLLAGGVRLIRARSCATARSGR
ncbi:hypothetical protein PG996_013820 [Apiospora saccharicola]|uniref:Uncharacterized protein n=1 Tax=Apiospora saccharicola TaxID=335842 RepID=A0ABR1TIH1_9PEZI